MLTRRRLLALSLAAATCNARAADERWVRLATADGRVAQVSFWSGRGRRRGTILFSHGALSAPNKYPALIEAWVSAGYDVWAPLHVDSTEHPDTARYPGMATWSARIEDLRALAKHVGARRVIAAGHSYGALVALALGGVAAEQPTGVTGALRIDNAAAVLAFSPPPPVPGLITAEGYRTLAVPALIQTGDRDNPPGTGTEGWKLHLAPYDAAAAGGHRFALVLAGVDHYFGGAICKFDAPGPAQTVPLQQAAALSVLFIDGYGANKAGARRMLNARLAESGPIILRRK